MSAGYVRTYYRVPAKRGMRVVADGRQGTIVGFDRQYLRIRLDGENRVGTWHPTWRIKYPNDPAQDEAPTLRGEDRGHAAGVQTGQTAGPQTP